MSQKYQLIKQISTFVLLIDIMFFRILAKLNKLLLPSYVHRDLTKLNAFDKAVIAFRLWVTKKVLN